MTEPDPGPGVDENHEAICPYCRRRFPSDEELRAHQRSDHPEERLAEEGA